MQAFNRAWIIACPLIGAIEFAYSLAYKVDRPMVILLKHCLCSNGCKVVTSIDVSLCLDAKKLKGWRFGLASFCEEEVIALWGWSFQLLKLIIGFDGCASACAYSIFCCILYISWNKIIVILLNWHSPLTEVEKRTYMVLLFFNYFSHNFYAS